MKESERASERWRGRLKKKTKCEAKVCKESDFLSREPKRELPERVNMTLDNGIE